MASHVDRLRKLRYRARTDLFWLARDLLGYKDLVEHVHGPLCSFFVRKDRTRPIEEQDGVKNRLILDPRGHFKTTLDIADTIQWLVNFPDIRIVLLTGTRELATRMVTELKYHFQKNEKFRAVFPEYAAPAKDWGTQQAFVVPARKALWLREPSVSISTLDSVKTGSHYEVLKYDDTVHERNIGTKDLIDKTITAFNQTVPLQIAPGRSYRDVIGTRYDYSDLYGWIIEHNVGEWKVLCRKVWSIDERGVKTLLFPERFTVAELEKMQADDPYIFNCQYLNDPTPVTQAQVTESDLESRFVKPHQIPPGRTFIAFDLGFSQREFADWSVGAVGRYDNLGRLWIVDLVRGRYSPFELVQVILHLSRKYQPVRIGIEKSGGAPLLEPGLRSAAHAQQTCLPLDWLPHPKEHKQERIAGLIGLLKQNKLFFASGLPDKDQLIREFVRFPRYRHDDIPDAISMLLQYSSKVDIALPADRVELVAIRPVPGCEELGAGLVG